MKALQKEGSAIMNLNQQAVKQGVNALNGYEQGLQQKLKNNPALNQLLALKAQQQAGIGQGGLNPDGSRRSGSNGMLMQLLMKDLEGKQKAAAAPGVPGAPPAPGAPAGQVKNADQYVKKSELKDHWRKFSEEEDRRQKEQENLRNAREDRKDARERR